MELSISTTCCARCPLTITVPISQGIGVIEMDPCSATLKRVLMLATWTRFRCIVEPTAVPSPFLIYVSRYPSRKILQSFTNESSGMTYPETACFSTMRWGAANVEKEMRRRAKNLIMASPLLVRRTVIPKMPDVNLIIPEGPHEPFHEEVRSRKSQAVCHSQRSLESCERQGQHHPRFLFQ